MRVLILILGISFAVDAWAACSPMPSCEELNYTDTYCSGEYVTCPFDSSKKKCLSLPKEECEGYPLTTCPQQGVCENCPENPARKRLANCLTPTPAELCAAYPLTTCPTDGVCERCPDDPTRLRLASCDFSASGQVCSDYPLTTCPLGGICEYCPDNPSRAKVTGCIAQRYLYYDKCYNTSCGSTFPNRFDLLIKAIEESSIIEDYANAWRNGGWLAYKDTFSESEIQMYTQDFRYAITGALNSTFCYSKSENEKVYVEDYYNSKYGTDPIQGGVVTQCCSTRDSAGKSTICSFIRDYVQQECQARGQAIVPYGVSGDVCLGFGHASWSGVEVPDYSGEIGNFYTLCTQAMKKAGLRYE